MTMKDKGIPLHCCRGTTL